VFLLLCPGAVINTMGWVESLGYELLLHAIETFRVDVVLVIGQERLYSQLNSKFHGRTRPDGSRVDVVKLNKSGGVVNRNPKHRQRTRMSRVKEYFYGVHGDLSPHAMTVGFSDVQVRNHGGQCSEDKV
jgi:polyribonucleotide 5'-hydroxyl-kinase